MPHTPRIGIQIGPEDPFWVQVREVMWQRAQALAVGLVEVTFQQTHLASPQHQAETVEDLIVQELDALIANTSSADLLLRILDRGLPVIYVSEIDLQHPLLTSRRGLYEAGHMLGSFLQQKLAAGTLLIVGGVLEGEDTGQSRLDGFRATLPAGCYTIHHVPSAWTSAAARPQLVAYLRDHPDLRIDALFGLSDSLALMARDVCSALGRLDRRTLVLGINGDPLALAAIADGTMAATVETDVDDIASRAVDLAYRATQGQRLPTYLHNRQRLVTADTITEVAVRKLISLAALPSRLVGVNQRAEQQRLAQIEAGLAINRQVGTILDERVLSETITTLIRDTYGFDQARFLAWEQAAARLIEWSGEQQIEVPLDPRGPLAYALAQDQTVFLPDTGTSHRFAPDGRFPELRSRVAVPVHHGAQIVGLLDLHHHRAAHHTREELDGLQLLADQLGIGMRNAELYGAALEARTRAEKADQLKTALLANVSHELRTPLNVILGYSRSTIEALSRTDGAAAIVQDLAQVYQSGEHLSRLINDLLDLSRAEIDELELLPEIVETHGFLTAIFRSSADTLGTNGAVEWRLDLPPTLPPMWVDPVRVRQVLFNLLHNAQKFTHHGQITLGARVASPELHLWVADTGSGIPQEFQGQIFEPFVSLAIGERRREGIGLGLSIARRLVALHKGRMLVESQPHRGSTFHIYLPLQPALAATPDQGSEPTLLVITATAVAPASLAALAERRGLALRLLHPDTVGNDFWSATQPTLLAWDLASATGWRLVEQARTHSALAQIPLLLYHSEADHAFTRAQSTTGMLVKPLAEEDMLATLRDLDPHTPNGSILIVEDDPQIGALHRRMIAEHFPGYAIHTVGDGRAAIEHIAHTPPSLLLLDLMLPEVDGFAVLEALRANPHTAAVPVLVLSGHPLAADDLRRLAARSVVFHTKDLLSEQELADSLRRSLTHDHPLPPHTSALVKAAIGFIHQHYAENLSRQMIANAVGVSKDYLGRIVQQELGLSSWEYLIRYRVLRAKELLRTTDYSIAEVATRVGFETATYFSHIFHREVGCSPRAYRSLIAETPKRRD